VELVYTKFVSLIASDPTIQTLLPLTPTGELCDVEGNCVDAAQDEMFKVRARLRRGLGLLGGFGAGSWAPVGCGRHSCTRAAAVAAAAPERLRSPTRPDSRPTPPPPAPPPQLTTTGGKLSVEREKVAVETAELDPSLIFEQDPVQILDALLPLYMNSCLLRR
jgi:hypothetical protein